MLTQSTHQSQRDARTPCGTSTPTTPSTSATSVNAQTTITLTWISAADTNFLQGQRQLITIAEALLTAAFVVYIVTSIWRAGDQSVLAGVPPFFCPSLSCWVSPILFDIVSRYLSYVRFLYIGSLIVILMRDVVFQKGFRCSCLLTVR